MTVYDQVGAGKNNYPSVEREDIVFNRVNLMYFVGWFGAKDSFIIFFIFFLFSKAIAFRDKLMLFSLNLLYCPPHTIYTLLMMVFSSSHFLKHFSLLLNREK